MKRVRVSGVWTGLWAIGAAIACVVLSASPSTATTLSFTCGFGTGPSCAEGAHPGSSLFDFEQEGASFVAELRFDEVLQPFSVTMDAVNVDFATMQARLVQFPGFVPVPIDPGNPDGEYVDFQIVTPPVAGQDYAADLSTRGPNTTLGYDLYIYWEAATDSLFHDAQVLHETGSTNGEFDSLITIPGSYTTDPPGCVFTGGCEFSDSLSFAPGVDPGVGGRDNMFTSFTVAATSPVPEPASMLLVATGAGVLYRRRQRTNASSRA